tara:strand:+ start:9030 stop:9371 length:342 start_codon:yes stop_codon:yes gene_type:complete
MSFTDELTQLIVVVVMLIAAYSGVMIWTRRSGGASKAGGGGGLFGMGGGAGSGGDDDAARPSLGLDDEDSGASVPKGADRHKGRFNLSGRDAEVAAKVLKRMLKQDPDEGGAP